MQVVSEDSHSQEETPVGKLKTEDKVEAEPATEQKREYSNLESNVGYRKEKHVSCHL